MLSYSRIRPRHLFSGLFLVTVVAAALLFPAFTAAARPQTPAPTTHSTTTHTTTPSAIAATVVRGPIGTADGIVPSGVTVFDQQYAAIRNLQPALLNALRDAATQGGRDGVPFVVSSGWRSVRYQQHLLDDAIARYGSAAEAARWVAPPALSEHVAGRAVDIANGDAQSWLLTHGATYGLCRVYANEPWHFELRTAAKRDGCPALYADAAHDPRFQP